MKLFISYSGSDYQLAETIKRQLEKHKIDCFLLETNRNNQKSNVQNPAAPDNEDWKPAVEEMIKDSDAVLLLVGNKSYQSKNIDWELETAIQYNKPIKISKFEAQNKLPEMLSDTAAQGKWCEIELSELESKPWLLSDNHYGLFNQERLSEKDVEILKEQYFMFVKTSEDLVERRQKVSEFYISINTLIAGAVGGVLTLDLDSSVLIAIIMVLSFVGCVLSFSWKKLLTSYGILNASKMKIIGLLEKKLPASLYDAEWNAQLEKQNTQKYVSFTDIEKKLPTIFQIVYIAILVSVAVMVIIEKML